jgi:hypothetical protein
MKNKFLLILIAAAIAVIAPACKKEPIKTQGSIVFWQTQSTAQDNTSLGITALYFKVAGKSAGSMGAGTYWNVAPDCGAGSAVTFIMDLGGESSQTVSYIVNDQDGDLVYDGTVTISNDQCIQMELQ